MSNASPGLYELCNQIQKAEKACRVAEDKLKNLSRRAGAWLKVRRQHLKVKRPELASRLGVSTGVVANWESGKDHFSTSWLMATVRVMDTIVEERDKQ